MTILNLMFFITGIAVCLFFALFAVTSVREKRPRAVCVSIVMLVVFGVVWFGAYALFGSSLIVQIGFPVAVVIFALLFLLPIGATTHVKINGTTERVDERDIMFAREEYEPGTEQYETYYKIHPEYKEIDDKIRSLPEILEPGGKYYDANGSAEIDRIFEAIEPMTRQVDGPVSDTITKFDPQKATDLVISKALELGADEVGIAELNQAYVYSHVGRGPEPWGAPIVNNHKYVIAFSVEMSYDQVEQAPRLPITHETALRYHQAAEISIKLAEFIRQLGYPARAQLSGSNYQVMLPAVAHDAGLGELGRHGYLISPTYGSRIRLGAVTTDIPLVPDSPVRMGVQEFCDICRKCAINCPSASIPNGSKTEVRGVEKWPLDIESCFSYWCKIGTDCGICMKVCPFSHPDTLTHNLVRYGISRSSFARWVSLYGDDLFYGKRQRI